MISSFTSAFNITTAGGPGSPFGMSNRVSLFLVTELDRSMHVSWLLNTHLQNRPAF